MARDKGQVVIERKQTGQRNLEYQCSTNIKTRE